MNAQELKKAVEDSQLEYHELDVDYKQHLLQYAVGLLIAQLTVIGFLLQNKTAQLTLKNAWVKTLFLIGISLTFVSIVLSMLAKRYSRDYVKNRMHSQTYRAISQPDQIDVNVDGFDFPEIENAEEKMHKHQLRGMVAVKYARWLFAWAEITLGLALCASVVFVYTVVIRL